MIASTADFKRFGIDIPHDFSGDEASTTCPQCSVSRKKTEARCLHVNLEKGVWYCHHCNWKGGIRNTKVYSMPTLRSSKNMPTLRLARKMLVDRGISDGVLDEMKVSHEKMFLPSEGKAVDCLVFPYFRGGICVNIKYRAMSKKSFMQFKDAEPIFYGMNTIKPESTELLICEGEIDVLSLLTVGASNVVSVPNGAPAIGVEIAKVKFDYLDTCSEMLERMSKVIFAGDNDGAGVMLQNEIARRIGFDKCWRVAWPDGCKDANDVLSIYGELELRSAMESARPWPIEGVLTTDDITDDVISLYFTGMEGGVSTGWPGVDKFYTVKPGELTIVTGIPSHGKSIVIDNLIYQLAMLHGWSFGMFSPENAPVHDHTARLIEKHIGRPFNKGKTPRMELEDVRRGLEWLRDRVIFLSPPMEDVTIDYILGMAKKLVLRYGIRGLVIDPWNELDHSRSRDVSMTEHVSICLTKIRRFARINECHVWVVAHPMKMRKEKGKDGKLRYPIPTPYDVSDSAAWRNRPDNCITIYRDFDVAGHKVLFSVQKVRRRIVGEVGDAYLELDTTCGKYYDEVKF